MDKFIVVDLETGEEPDIPKICRTEPWAKYLLAHDIDGFVMAQDGTLMLIDDCNNIAVCPNGRFTVVFGKVGECDG